MIDPTFSGLLDRPAGLLDRPLLWDDVTGVWLSERRVAALSLALAAKLEQTEKCLAFLFATNTSATLVGFLGLLAAGHAVALIDPTLPDDKLSNLLTRYQPEFLLGSEPLAGVGPTAAEAWELSDPTLESPAIAVRKVRTGQPRPHPDLGALLLTSGTTGSAKFVRLSHAALAANARQISESLALTPNSVAIGHLPFHYSYGLSVATSHLVSGGRIAFINDPLTSESFWTKVKASDGTHFPGVPFHYSVLARLGFDMVPPSVDTFTQAGGHLDRRIQETILTKANARAARVFVMYGQTEAAPRIACVPSDRLHEKLGSVGLAMPGGKLCIAGPDGTPLPTGETGLVAYEGPNVMLGYAESRSDLAQGDVMGGKLETGDLGWMDGEGFLYLSGRAARFAKIAGLRLSLDDLERQLSSLGSVACVDLGDRIAAVFEGEIPQNAKAHTKALALANKVPPTSFALRELAELPRKANGKIDYALVKVAVDV